MISVGFAAYLVLLGFERGLLTNPLIANSAARNAAERTASARFSLTITLTAALPAAGVLAVLGVVLPAPFGQGLLLFAPWLLPALVQDLGRSVLFRDGRGRNAALADATWLLVMAASAPIAFATRSEWAVTGCWGAGAIAAAAIALWKIRWKPARLADAVAWWKREAWPFGRWMLMGGMAYAVASYTAVLALAGILGARDYGGLRAVQSVFAPLTLIGPAIALPGLPLISRVLATSPRRALAIAWQLAGVTALITASYLVVLYAFPGLLSLVFGQEFGGFRSIMVPIGVTQLLAAPIFALTLFLTAQQRGSTLLRVGTLSAVLVMGFSVGFGAFFGLTGAAWGGAIGTALGGFVLIAALRQPKASGDGGVTAAA